MTPPEANPNSPNVIASHGVAAGRDIRDSTINIGLNEQEVGRQLTEFAARLGPGRDGDTTPEIIYRRSLGKLWIVINIVLFCCALGAWIMTQFGFRVLIPLYSIVLCSVLLSVTSAIGFRIAIAANGAWVDRIPMVWFWIDPRTLEGTIYQGLQLSMFSILPTIALIRFWVLFLNAQVVTTDNPSHRVENIWTWSALSSSDPARLCPDSFGPLFPLCKGGVTFYPGLEPTILALITSTAFAMAAAHWWSVFRKGATPSVQ
jgi:hypothetical protein